MKALMKELLRLTEVRQLTEDVENGVSPVLITGVSPVHRAQVEAALHLKTRRPLVVLCPDEREARRQAGGAEGQRTGRCRRTDRDVQACAQRDVESAMRATE